MGIRNGVTINGVLQRLPAMFASIAVGVVPVLILINQFGVSRKLIVGWGVIAYIVGVTVVKMPLYHLFVVRVLHPRLSQAWLSAAQGLVSALSELGVALFFFIFVVPHLTFVQLIGFGMAAGAVEAVMLPFIRNPLKGTALEGHSAEVIERASGKTFLSWMSVLERILALFPHIAARGLVYVSYATGNLAPALLGVSGFAFIDGRAYYAHLQKWAFDDIHVLAKFYRFLAVVGLCLSAAFLAFYQHLM